MRCEPSVVHRRIFRDLAYEKGLSIYAVVGVTFLVYSFYAAYYLTKNLWVEPDLRFVFEWRNERFPQFGFALCIVPPLVILLFLLLGNDLVLTRPQYNLARIGFIIIGFVISYVFFLTLIPFSIAISIVFLALAGIVCAVLYFRHRAVDPSLPPDATVPRDDLFRIRIELAHERWISIQRESTWMIITVIFAVLIQGVLAFQTRLYPAFTGERGWIALVFARYQLSIFAAMFIYYALGPLLLITQFCYKKQLSLERMLGSP
jgi:hypothetical protein